MTYRDASDYLEQVNPYDSKSDDIHEIAKFIGYQTAIGKLLRKDLEQFAPIDWQEMSDLQDEINQERELCDCDRCKETSNGVYKPFKIPIRVKK